MSICYLFDSLPAKVVYLEPMSSTIPTASLCITSLNNCTGDTQEVLKKENVLWEYQTDAGDRGMRSCRRHVLLILMTAAVRSAVVSRILLIAERDGMREVRME